MKSDTAPAIRPIALAAEIVLALEARHLVRRGRGHDAGFDEHDEVDLLQAILGRGESLPSDLEAAGCEPGIIEGNGMRTTSSSAPSILATSPASSMLMPTCLPSSVDELERRIFERVRHNELAGLGDLRRLRDIGGRRSATHRGGSQDGDRE